MTFLGGSRPGRAEPQRDPPLTSTRETDQLVPGASRGHGATQYAVAPSFPRRRLDTGAFGTGMP